MNDVTKETRFDSWLKTGKLTKREKLILSVLTKPMTARQICRELGFSNMNSVRPRLTELVNKGYIEVTEKAYDKSTRRMTAIYRRVK